MCGGHARQMGAVGACVLCIREGVICVQFCVWQP